MITIWHNPRCSKSRQAVALLEEKGVEIDIFKYLQEPLTAAMLSSLLSKLGISARELMRTKETLYAELALETADDAQLIAAMVAHPRLIERPIIIKENRAVIGRPLEKVNDLLA
ncbi:MAG: arsenate reductase (glutaredoxin) [Sulfurimonas sp.]|nr:MAG: arsenate reductase (glutaredoxin) [Sulfurimonas sp.]